MVQFIKHSIGEDKGLVPNRGTVLQTRRKKHRGRSSLSQILVIGAHFD